MFTAGIIHNSQDVETIQMSISKWMDGEKVIQTYNRVPLGLEKEGTCTFIHFIVVMNKFTHLFYPLLD